MSAKIAIQQMERFISSLDSEVMAITGRWGVGKTYAWQKTIDAHRGEIPFLKTRYSYVSAFGLQSVDELKSAILQATDTLDDPNPGSRWKTFAEQLFDDGLSLENIQKASATAKRAGAKAAGSAKVVLSSIPVVEKLAHLGEKLSFQAIRNQIICIDDIERAGASLGVATILGVASELKEQRKCKVILLLNKEGLDEEEKVFDTYLEKVCDQAIKFEPTPEEAANLALGKDVLDILLKERTIRLGITNIRVIRRIRKIIGLIEPKFTNLHDTVVSDVVTSFAIIGWGLFEPYLGPDIDELKEFNGLSESLKRIISKDYKEKEMTRTREIVNKYGFTNFDGLDYQILDGMKAGWFKDDNILPLLEKMNADARVEGLRQAIQAPYDVINGSFDNDIENVIASLSQTALNYATYMSPGQITDRSVLLEELGRATLAAEVITKYIEAIPEMTVKNVLSLSASDAEPARAHPAIRAAVSQKVASETQSADPKDTLMRIGSQGAWNPEQIEFLAGLPVSRYVEVVRALRGHEISTVIYAALKFENFPDAQYKKIANNMRQALEEIGADSDLNRFRVRRFLI